MSASYVLALIPARSGSKGILHKNVQDFDGKPLLAHSIQHAVASKTVDRVIVSTDSPEYAEIARSFDAETPFLRPPDISGDLSTDLEVFQHALAWLKKNEGDAQPDICVHLRPTCPLRAPTLIDQAVAVLRADPTLDSVRTIAPAPETPLKMWWRGEDGILSPVAEAPDLPEAYNRPRQSLPQAWLQNASVDVLRAKVVLEQNSMTGSRIYGLVDDHNHDIDLVAQFERAEVAAKLTGAGKHLTFCFDIDGVLATVVADLDYAKARPITDNIRLVNALYDQGHEIVLFTARGSKTGVDWSALTARQMQEWGVRHQTLTFGKPAADYYIDDRFVPVDLLSAIVKP